MKFPRFRRFTDAALGVPRMTYLTLRHGVAPTGARAVTTLMREGPEALHWKVLGDAIVEVFQSSGPVLTKLGQILATRDDVLPKHVAARLERLYSKQPPMKARVLARSLKRAFPKGLPFESFEHKALAVGSVGQVHRARLDGVDVIVKVIRPGIAREIERDMNTLRVIVDALFSRHPILSRALADLRAGFEQEVDLKNEARALADFGKRFARNPRVCVPRCHAHLSTSEVLVMDELKGVPLSKYREQAARDPEAAKKIASLALGEILSQVFLDGRFHADPHGGNLLVLDDGRLGLIDLGLTGELTGTDRKNIARAVRAFVKRDAEGVIRALLDFGTTPEGFDFEAFSNDIKAAVKPAAASPKDAQLEKLVGDLFGVAHRHQIYVPQPATLLIKTLVTIEGVARSIDPEISLIATAAPVILKSLTPKWLRFDFWGRS